MIGKETKQKPIRDPLILLVAEQLDRGDGEACFSSLDIAHAYGKVAYGNKTTEHCFSRRFGGDATATNGLTTSFHGLKNMALEFQKCLGKTLQGISFFYALLDEILVVSKCYREENLNKVPIFLRRVNDANIRLNLEIFIFGEKEVNWFSFRHSRSEKHLNSNIPGILIR